MTSHHTSLGTKAQLLTSFLQIMTNLAGVYLVIYPREFSDFISSFELVNFDVLSAGFHLECEGIERHTSRVLLAILVPLATMLFFTLSGCFFGAVSTTRRDFTQAPAQIRLWLIKALQPCLIIAFLSLPAVSSLAFRSFRCDCLDDGVCYLMADYGLKCGVMDEGVMHETDEFAQLRGVAFTGIVLYPVAMPTVLAGLLWQVSDTHRWITKVTRHASGGYTLYAVCMYDKHSSCAG